MKTLHLNLKRKWYDMILSGEKTEEYRDIKHYWCGRLMNRPFSFMSETPEDILKDLDVCPNGVFQEPDTITFSNGYQKDRDQFVIELKGIEVDFGSLKWGAKPLTKYFVLKLGKIITDV